MKHTERIGMQSTDPHALLKRKGQEAVDTAMEQVEWAEDEIAKAQARHPAAMDDLFHSFNLLSPTHERMKYERVHRSHCRELLDRVALGADTRACTAAEICCSCATAGLRSVTYRGLHHGKPVACRYATPPTSL
jgi:hypothetical protein